MWGGVGCALEKLSHHRTHSLCYFLCLFLLLVALIESNEKLLTQQLAGTPLRVTEIQPGVF